MSNPEMRSPRVVLRVRRFVIGRHHAPFGSEIAPRAAGGKFHLPPSVRTPLRRGKGDVFFRTVIGRFCVAVGTEGDDGIEGIRVLPPEHQNGAGDQAVSVEFQRVRIRFRRIRSGHSRAGGVDIQHGLLISVVEKGIRRLDIGRGGLHDGTGRAPRWRWRRKSRRPSPSRRGFRSPQPRKQRIFRVRVHPKPARPRKGAA